MDQQNTLVIFPKKHEFRFERDPLDKMAYWIQIHGFDGPKKYFWHTVAILKGFILLGRTIYAFQSFHDPKKLTELTATYPIRFMAVFKLFYLYFDRKRLTYFFKNVKDEFWDCSIVGPILEKKLLARLEFTHWLLVSHFSISNFCLIMIIIFPLVEMPDGKKPLPNIIWTPFDTNTSPLYEILYVYLLWNLFLSLLANGFYDCAYMYALVHLDVQFDILKELLRNLSTGIMEESTDMEKFNSNDFQRKVMDRLKICVEHHTVLLRYGKNLEKFGSIVLIPQLVMSYIALVVNGYILSVDHSDLKRTMMLANLSSSFLVQLTVFAVPASIIKEKSTSILGAVIESKWYLFRAPIKKSLTLLLLNAEKGITINAAGMTDLNNEVLVAILRNVFSAITLLQALID